MLCGIGNAQRLGIHAYKEHMGFPPGGLHQKGSLATAKVEPHLVKASKSCGCKRSASLGPMSGKACGLQLNNVCIALEAFLEHKVPRQTRVHTVHLLLLTAKRLQPQIVTDPL